MTQKYPTWHYDEFKQVGRDYGAQAEVEVYDSSHSDFRDEYSTYDRVIDGLLARAGFTILEKRIELGVLGTYLCAK